MVLVPPIIIPIYSITITLLAYQVGEAVFIAVKIILGWCQNDTSSSSGIVGNNSLKSNGAGITFRSVGAANAPIEELVHVGNCKLTQRPICRYSCRTVALSTRGWLFEFKSTKK